MRSSFSQNVLTTRAFPGEFPGLYPLSLRELKCESDCLAVIVSVLHGRMRTIQEFPNNVLSEILNFSSGHPLTLTLLAAKLCTQGPASIAGLSKISRPELINERGDDYITVMLNYIFDDRFFDLVGDSGRILLKVIATYPDGVKDDTARAAVFQTFGLSSADFDETLRHLFETNCVHRISGPRFNTLAMHALSRGFFALDGAT